MSATTEVTIWCDGIMDDGFNCSFWLSSDTVPTAPTYSALREVLATNHGWVKRGRKDFCPTCVNEGRA